ncbi:MAG: VanZ family protein [Chitinophagales bacterium]
MIKIYRIGLGLWIVVLTYLSLKPSSTSLPLFPHADKVVHFVFYGVLCLLSFSAYGKKTKGRQLVYLALACFFYGIFLEIMQRFATKSRFFEGLDIVANGIGVFSASIVYSMFKKKKLWV